MPNASIEIDYLEEMTAADMWTANKYIKEPTSDGGCSCIPTLKTKDEEGARIYINDDEPTISSTLQKRHIPPLQNRLPSPDMHIKTTPYKA